jgi:hypothetical protein
MCADNALLQRRLGSIIEAGAYAADAPTILEKVHE